MEMFDPFEHLPNHLKTLVTGILEGRVRQYALVVEYETGGCATGFEVINDETYNSFTLLGGIEVLKQDFFHNRMGRSETSSEGDDE